MEISKAYTFTNKKDPYCSISITTDEDKRIKLTQFSPDTWKTPNKHMEDYIFYMDCIKKVKEIESINQNNND